MMMMCVRLLCVGDVAVVVGTAGLQRVFNRSCGYLMNGNRQHASVNTLIKWQRLLLTAPEQPLRYSCWKCGSNSLSPLICSSCNTVMKVASEPVSYFQLLDIPQGFDINGDGLETKFYDTMKLLHPDKFGMEPKDVQDAAAETAAILNNAFSTMRSPLKRAEYLLELNGVGLTDESRMEFPSVIMQIMEMNEKVDGCNDEEKLESFDEDIEEKRDAILVQLSTAFKKKDFPQAKEHTIMYKYLGRVQEQIRNKLDNF
eukprot:m.68196 g.68196  ORF g.68196 m.68196 type:complete len:257 (+) comp8239_c0_seq1:126-896(+)